MEDFTNCSLDELLKFAAKKDVDAQAAAVARLLIEARGPKDYVLAAEYGEKAIAKGRVDIAPLVARLYFEGAGELKRDVEKALKYTQMGADARDVECLLRLATEYYVGANGVEKDDAKAFACLYNAVFANTDDTNLQGSVRYALANMYFEGRGVNKNVEEAINWYLKALSKRCTLAYVGLVKCYEEKNMPEQVAYYAKNLFNNGEDNIRELAVSAYNRAIDQIATKVPYKAPKLSEVSNDKDRSIHGVIHALDKKLSEYKDFEAEADRLVKNAQTYARIGNYKRVFPAYERVTDEYPHDFRGWYNLARVFTDNFAVYSIFSCEGYGKMEQAEYNENIVYAQRTVEAEFENELSDIKNKYEDGCIDISIAQMKNFLASAYSHDDPQGKVADFVRQYEEKIVYIYNHKPTVATALTLHLLLNVLENDSIKKYNEKVLQHNASLDEKVTKTVNDYVAQLAQQLKINNPKDYATNAEALEEVNSDPKLQQQVEEYKQKVKAGMEYYSTISGGTSIDTYDPESFGDQKPYSGYIPTKTEEFDDEYVDFIIALAQRCSIQMRSYEEFYTPERRRKIAEFEQSQALVDSARLEYFKQYLFLKGKYSAMTPQVEPLFDELADLTAEYENAYVEYDKARSSNVFMQVFKTKEQKEDREDVFQNYNALLARLDELRVKITARAHEEINSLNAEFISKYPSLGEDIATYNENIIDSSIRDKFKQIIKDDN